MGKTKTKPTTFLRKTFAMLSNSCLQSIVKWNDVGDSFSISDTNAFSEQVLPQYFRHNNIASFVRQLNMYDFHKIRVDGAEHAFKHSLFKRDAPELLLLIKRKTSDAPYTVNVPCDGAVEVKDNYEGISREPSDLNFVTKKLRQEIACLTKAHYSMLHEIKGFRRREANYQQTLLYLMHWTEKQQGYATYGSETLTARLLEATPRLTPQSSQDEFQRPEFASIIQPYSTLALHNAEGTSSSHPELEKALLTSDGLNAFEDYFSAS